MVPWETRFEQLVDYKVAHGHCMVPMIYEENPPLAGWVKTMRKNYKKYQKGENSSLTTEKIAKLNDLGFQWELRKFSNRRKVPWQTHIKELKEFQKLHGHCRVTKKFWKNNHSLANWVSNTRVQYGKLKKGEKSSSSLTAERIAELNSLGFEWRIQIPSNKTPTKSGIGNLPGVQVIENNRQDDERQDESTRSHDSAPDLETQEEPSAKKQRISQQEDSTDTDSMNDEEDKNQEQAVHQTMHQSGLDVRHNEVGETPQQVQQHDLPRKPSLGERLRAKFEARVIVISL